MEKNFFCIDLSKYRLITIFWNSLPMIFKDHQQDLGLALLYKIVIGHVAINPDQIGLVAADNRTRANHTYKFRAIGASSPALLICCQNSQ